MDRYRDEDDGHTKRARRPGDRSLRKSDGYAAKTDDRDALPLPLLHPADKQTPSAVSFFLLSSPVRLFYIRVNACICKRRLRALCYKEYYISSNLTVVETAVLMASLR